MSTEQEMKTRIESELFRHLPDEKFAKPQVDAEQGQGIDITVEMSNALANPLEFPPLSQSVFAGDTVAIGIQSDLPHPDLVLVALVQYLATLDIETADIIVVVTPRTAERLGIPREVYFSPDANRSEGKAPIIFPVTFGFHSINFQVHDPENEVGCSYLVANSEGEPIYVNRALVDADVILPIGCPAAGDANQQSDCIYPDFSNEGSRARLATGQSTFLSRWQEVELANDTLGSFFTIQVVCGPGGTVRNIFCGARKDATDQARRATNELWTFDWPQDSEMTVGTIESDAQYQDWNDFANALIAASRVTTSDGPIVIWSEIGAAPDQKTRQACLAQFDDGQRKKMSKTMRQVSAIVSERPVFLRSKLGQNATEEIGLGYIKSGEEVVKIAEPYAVCLLMRDAHKCQISKTFRGDVEGVSHE